MLKLKNVSKTYGSGERACRALVRVDLVIGAGEFVAVVGRSGSGKSTLANLVTGIDRASEGSVSVAGTDLGSLTESSLAAWRAGGVGIVFQSFQLLPTLTVSENVELPMEFAGVAAGLRSQRASVLLSRMGVEDQAGKLPTTLSGGQQQRVAIARALANDPPLLVADEPTGNLDSTTAKMVMDELARLALSGKTVFLVTHERDVSEFVDRVVTLADGRVVSDVVGGRAFRNRGGAS
jgi:putative ABC transport system ATP-binding protein